MTQPDAEPRDLYEVLEIEPDADDAEVRRAYQKLARRHHPDVRPDDAEAKQRYEEASRAFEVLSDPDRRRRYDALRTAEGQRAAAWFGRWSESEEVLAGGSGTWVRTSRRVEVRGELRGGPLPGAADEAGLSRVEVELDFAEMVRGTTRSFPLQRETPCEDCGGTGRQGGSPCPRCVGRGAVIELERVRVRIPRGVENGARLRLEGKGAPLGPGRQGDLLIVLHVRPHAYFRRDGHDVHADLPLTLAEAILGADVEVPTIDGPVRVKIPPGTQGGRRIRLRSRGIQPASGEPGDHYAHVTVAVPQEASPALRELLARISQPDLRRDLPSEAL
jgi:molecular chaperone DnaJ